MRFEAKYEFCTINPSKTVCLIGLQVGWFTADGAAVNGASLRVFETELDSADEGWLAEQHDILCIPIGRAFTSDHQIRASPQARAFFRESCTQVEVPTLELLLWIRTRWASLYHFLDRILVMQKVGIYRSGRRHFILIYHQGINQFVLLADAS